MILPSKKLYSFYEKSQINGLRPRQVKIEKKEKKKKKLMIQSEKAKKNFPSYRRILTLFVVSITSND